MIAEKERALAEAVKAASNLSAAARSYGIAADKIAGGKPLADPPGELRRVAKLLQVSAELIDTLVGFLEEQP